MKSHVDYIIPNLQFIVKSYKEKHGGELRGIDKNIASVAYRYLQKGNCEGFNLITLDDLARAFGVEWCTFFLPLGSAKPIGKYFASAFSNNLCYYRKQSKIPLSSLARDAGLGYYGTITNYETRKSVPPLNAIQNIANALEIEVLEMFRLNIEPWRENGIIL